MKNIAEGSADGSFTELGDFARGSLGQVQPLAKCVLNRVGYAAEGITDISEKAHDNLLLSAVKCVLCPKPNSGFATVIDSTGEVLHGRQEILLRIEIGVFSRQTRKTHGSPQRHRDRRENKGKRKWVSRATSAYFTRDLQINPCSL
jgi:hypothetical protein